MNIVITGHGLHGKDTVAEMLGLPFRGSSEIASELVIFDKLKDKYGYATPLECFNDRRNHRAEWHELIKEYNRDDKARLVRDIFTLTDVYVGLRCWIELEESRRQGLVDLVIWVDASRRLPPESSKSMTLSKKDADLILDNSGTVKDLETKVSRLAALLKKMKHSRREEDRAA